jgi:hypothetical protein
MVATEAACENPHKASPRKRREAADGTMTIRLTSHAAHHVRALCVPARRVYSCSPMQHGYANAEVRISAACNPRTVVPVGYEACRWYRTPPLSKDIEAVFDQVTCVAVVFPGIGLRAVLHPEMPPLQGMRKGA